MINLYIDNGHIFKIDTGVKKKKSNILPFSRQTDLKVLNNLSLNTNVNSSTCGLNNGSIIVEVTGGTPPFAYSLFTMYGEEKRQNNGSFQNLVPDPYTIVVTDADNNTISEVVNVTNINAPPKLLISSYKNATGCDTDDARVVLSVVGGTPPYEYTMDRVTFQSSNIFDNLTAGTYTFSVRDANGCLAAESNFLIGTLAPSSCRLPIGSSHSAMVCNNNGTIWFSVNEVTNSPYTYSMDGVNFSTDGEFNNLNPGTHKIYFKNVLGKLWTFSVSIQASCEITLDATFNLAECEESNGEIIVEADDGVAPYMYSMDGINYQSSNIFSGLRAGNYDITVKDNNGKTKSKIFTLGDNCPEISLVVGDTHCGLDNGTITVIPIKGIEPFTYSLDGIDFQVSPIFNGLSTGSYTIIAKDAMGFMATQMAKVNNTCINITASLVSPSCNKSNGSVTLSASGGVGPYIYSIDGVGYQLSPTFNNLSSGQFTVMAKDAAGAVGVFNFELNDTPGPILSLISSPTSCKGNDGFITAAAMLGTAPYRFSIDGINFKSSPEFNGLAINTYQVWVEDSKGCKTMEEVIIGSSCPQLTVIKKEETCSEQNGIIEVIASQGTPPYTFSVDGTSFQSSPVFQGLQAGNYTIVIKDALNVLNSVDIVLINICPSVVLKAVDGYCQDAGAKIMVKGEGGFPPYKYSIDGLTFVEEEVFNGLSDGVYTIIIKDAGGLTSSSSIEVKNHLSPVVEAVVTDASCLDNDGKTYLRASQGTVPYLYNINGGAWQNAPEFINLASGSYRLAVKDKNDCITEVPVVLDMENNIYLTLPTDTTMCETDALKVNITSNATHFSWTSANSNSPVNGPDPVFHFTQTTKLYVTASLGVCGRTDSIIVYVNKAPIANAGDDINVCYGKDVYLKGSGGVEYIWSPVNNLINSRTASPYIPSAKQTTVYSLSVIDANGCMSVKPDDVMVKVTSMPKLFAGYDTAIILNQPFQLNAIDINASNFIFYEWSPKTGLNNAYIANPLVTISSSEKYTVTAKTAEGCTGIDDIVLKPYVGPEIYVPTGFTPNNDGINDKLFIVPVGMKAISFSIYNRWGALVFHTSNSSIGWDGRYRGQLLPTAVFTWVANGIDMNGKQVVKKGTITLIR